MFGHEVSSLKCCTTFDPTHWRLRSNPSGNFKLRLFGMSIDLAYNQLILNSLAQAEIGLVLAVLYRPGGPQFELFETDESDVIHVHDFLIPLPKLDTKGVRILIR